MPYSTLGSLQLMGGDLPTLPDAPPVLQSPGGCLPAYGVPLPCATATLPATTASAVATTSAAVVTPLAPAPSKSKWWLWVLVAGAAFVLTKNVDSGLNGLPADEEEEVPTELATLGRPPRRKAPKIKHLAELTIS